MLSHTFIISGAATILWKHHWALPAKLQWKQHNVVLVPYHRAFISPLRHRRTRERTQFWICTVSMHVNREQVPRDKSWDAVFEILISSFPPWKHPCGAPCMKSWAAEVVLLLGVEVSERAKGRYDHATALSCVTDFFGFVYQILPAATDASLSVCEWEAAKEQDSASAKSHGAPDFKRLPEQKWVLPEAEWCKALDYTWAEWLIG